MRKGNDAVSLASVVYHAVGDVRLEPMDKPRISNGEVLVRVEACAVCGTDVKAYLKGNPRIRAPMVMGHEFCGTIVEATQGVQDYACGQRVTMAPAIGCGCCLYCQKGKTNLCQNVEVMGFHYPGAMAPYVRIPAKAVAQGYLVPVGDLDAEIAALSEPLSCVVNNYGHVPQNQIQSVLIIGLGPLGIMHALVARTMGIENICGVDLLGKRAETAQQFNFRAVATTEQIAKEYRHFSGGEGFDLVVVTAPDNVAQANALSYARKGGYVSLFGSLPVGEELLHINSRTIHYHELCLYGTSDSTVSHVTRAVRILQSDEQLFRSIVTHRFPLTEFAQAVANLRSGSALKVMLIPWF